ncbi:hypothetical protein OO014_06010 [Intrasporangium calvum]|uniref:SAF domain-containing protein n=1 Tax=Intrasporangium calvum TaxID=53358 RepID=A0ABT5GFX4_9MICO|nr:hypothetical protein [Intrasporangium calvum]MDC5696806.1 hypothetical protein [Intrasporangium calvum]
MSELAAPTAKRLEKPSWRDSRLIVGVILVLASAALGARLVATADNRTPYYVAVENLVAGDRVTASTFRPVEVALADGMGGYLRADAPIPQGKLITRDLQAGELVPSSALGEPGEVDVQRVTVRTDAVATAGLDRGQRVDVYVTTDDATPGSGDEASAGTTRLLDGVAVVGVHASEGGFGAAARTSVQLYVPAAEVQAVVEAVDHDAKITLVPVSGGGVASGADDA